MLKYKNILESSSMTIELSDNVKLKLSIEAQKNCEIEYIYNLLRTIKPPGFAYFNHERFRGKTNKNSIIGGQQ